MASYKCCTIEQDRKGQRGHMQERNKELNDGTQNMHIHIMYCTVLREIEEEEVSW